MATRVLCVVLAMCAAGCSDGRLPIACTAIAVAGLSVQVTNSATGQPICDAAVTATDGAYTERLRESACRFQGAYERAGTYAIRAERSGFISTELPSVRVVMGVDECPHVLETRVLISLPPRP